MVEVRMDRDAEIAQRLAHIRAFAQVITTYNWRDILMRIEEQGKALEALTSAEQLLKDDK